MLSLCKGLCSLIFTFLFQVGLIELSLKGCFTLVKASVQWQGNAWKRPYMLNKSFRKWICSIWLILKALVRALHPATPIFGIIKVFWCSNHLHLNVDRSWKICKSGSVLLDLPKWGWEIMSEILTKYHGTFQAKGHFFVDFVISVQYNTVYSK